MITGLILNNFKKHANLSVSFENGLCVVVGPNYAGKSSILDGILFALFGPQAVDGGMEVCRKRGEDRTSVSLSFVVNNDRYVLQRSSSTASLKKEDKLVAKSASAVNNHLETLLGMNRKRFLQMRVAKQKETEALLTTGTTELHKIIEDASGAHVITQALDLLKPRISAANTALEVLEPGNVKALTSDLEVVEYAETVARSSLTVATDSRNELSLVQRRAQDYLGECLEHNRWCYVQHTGRIRLDSELQKAQQHLDATVAFLAENKGVGQEEEESRIVLEAMEDTASRLQRDIRDLTVAKAEVEKHGRKLQYAKQQQTSESDATRLLPPNPEESLVDEIRQELTDTLAKAAVQASEVKTMESASSESVCPTCNRPMEGVDPEDLAKKWQEAAHALVQIKGKVADTKSRLALYVHSQTQWKEHHDAQDRWLKEITEATEASKPYHETVERLKDAEHDSDLALRIKTAKEDVRSLSTLRAQFNIHADSQLTQLDEIARIQGVVKNLGEPAKEIQHSEHDLDIMRGKIDDLATKLSDFNHQIGGARATIDGKKSEANLIKRMIGQAKATNERIAANELVRDSGTKLTKFLRDHRDTFLQEAWAGVTAYASQFAQGCTGGDIEAVLRSDDGVFKYMEAGEIAPIAGASGAQSSIMGLGIQIALGQMIPTALDVLLLDEPTADMTPEVSMAAMSLIKSAGSQTIVISHRELDGSLADQIIQL
jgi:DNA repair exonuclease SbcCD ATPase subunit